MRTLVATLFLFLSVMYCSCHTPGDGCYSPWKKIGSGCYLIRQQKVSPDTAFALCSHYDAYLANLETSEEALLIQYELKQMKTVRFNVTMRTLVATLFLFLSVMYCSCHTPGDGCYSPWKKIGSGCYLIRQQKVSPDTAFALCSHYDAYLANLETSEEALLIQYELKQMKTGIHYIVGGRNINRYLPGGDWRWINGGNMTKMTYFAFSKEQPDGSNAYPQDCLFLYANHQYQWHDIYCYDSYYNGGYICEK